MKNVEDLYPLSPMQEGMLFHALYAPGSGAYAVHISFHIEGDLNIPIFKRCWEALVERHTILRSVLVWEQVNQSLQVVRKQASLGWEEFDWSDRLPEEQEQELRNYIGEQHRRGFDLAQAPLMRMALARLGETSYQFVWNYSHILLDAWSVNILFAELLHYFRAYSAGPVVQLPAPRPYREFIAWLQQQNKTKAEEFWRRKLSGFSNPTAIPSDLNAANREDHASEYLTEACTIGKAAIAKLQAVARQHRFTMATLVEGAWAWVLGHYCHSDDVVFGVTVNGRPVSLKGANEIVGLLVNTLPARVQIQFDRPLAAWLKTIHDHQVESREYGFCSLVEIKTWSDVQGATPLFDSLVVFENYPVAQGVQKLDDSVRLVGSSLLQNSAYPLAIAAEPNEDGMALRLHFDKQRFSPGSAAMLLNSLQTVLEIMAENTSMKVGELSLANAVGRQLQLEWDADKLANIAYLCELSPMQEQLLPQRAAGISPSSCLAQAIFTAVEQIDLSQLEKSLQAQMRQHDVLRASVLWQDIPQPVQIVHHTLPVPIQQTDWRHRSRAENGADMCEFLRADRQQGFLLSQAPPFRIHLLKLADLRSRVVVTYDQFLIDSWSIRKIMGSVLSNVPAATDGSELSTVKAGSYRDWVKSLNQQDYTAAEAFWRRELEDVGPYTLLGRILPAATPSDGNIARQELSLSEALIQQVRRFAAQHEFQLSTIILGAWAVLLSRYTYQSDLMLAVAVPCRTGQPGSSFDHMIGNLVALVPLRLQVTEQDLLFPWLMELQKHASEAFKYACVPWNRLSGLRGFNERSPFDHVISFDDSPHTGEKPSSTFMDSVYGSFGASPMAITVEAGETLSIACVYSTSVFASRFVEGMLRHFHCLLEQIVSDSAETIERSFPASEETLALVGTVPRQIV